MLEHKSVTQKWRLMVAGIVLLLVLWSQVGVQTSYAMGNCDNPDYWQGPWDAEKSAEWNACQNGNTHSTPAPAPSGSNCDNPDYWQGTWDANKTREWNACQNGSAPSTPAPQPLPGGSNCDNPDYWRGPWDADKSREWDSCQNNGPAQTPVPTPSVPTSTPAPGGTPTPNSTPAPTETSAAPTPTPTRRYSQAHIDQRLDDTVDRLHDFSRIALKEQNITYRPPSRIERYYSSPDSQNPLYIPGNAFYIPAMNAIFIDMNLINDFSEEFGDYAGVSVLAHEWGHMIQDQMGIFGTGRPLRYMELQADCFAGAFTTHLDENGWLMENDIEEGIDLFYAIGDDILHPDAPDQGNDGHGTGRERQSAFINGLNEGVQTCLNGYQ